MCSVSSTSNPVKEIINNAAPVSSYHLADYNYELASNRYKTNQFGYCPVLTVVLIYLSIFHLRKHFL